MRITGTLVKKLEVQSGQTDRGTEWKNQTLVFEHVDAGVQEWAKTFVVKVGNNKDARVNVDYVERLELGSVYEVGVNVNSREYNGKYYTTLNAWSFSQIQHEKDPF